MRLENDNLTNHPWYPIILQWLSWQFYSVRPTHQYNSYPFYVVHCFQMSSIFDLKMSEHIHANSVLKNTYLLSILFRKWFWFGDTCDTNTWERVCVCCMPALLVKKGVEYELTNSLLKEMRAVSVKTREETIV